MKQLSNLISVDKKGQVRGAVYSMVGALIIIVLAVALAPTMFANLTDISGAPDWFGTVAPVLVSSGLIFMIWRAFNGR